MSDDIASKLASLKNLKSEMKDWKKDDLKKKKDGNKVENKQDSVDPSRLQDSVGGQSQAQAQGDDKADSEQDNSLLAQILAKLSKK